MRGGADQLDAARVRLMIGLGALEAGQERVVDVDAAPAAAWRRARRRESACSARARRRRPWRRARSPRPASPAPSWSAWSPADSGTGCRRSRCGRTSRADNWRRSRRSPSAVRRCASDRADRRGNGRSATPAARRASFRRAARIDQVIVERGGEFGEGSAQRGDVGRFVGAVERDAHEEIAGFGVVELLRVEDVESALEQGRRNLGDDSRPIGARQRQDVARDGHGRHPFPKRGRAAPAAAPPGVAKAKPRPRARAARAGRSHGKSAAAQVFARTLYGLTSRQHAFDRRQDRGDDLLDAFARRVQSVASD